MSGVVGVPVIASGGAGGLSHFYDAFTKGKAMRCWRPSLFHYGEIAIGDPEKLFGPKGRARAALRGAAHEASQGGARMVKSAFAVLICFCIDYFREGSLPFYSAIAAVLCMQPEVSHSVKVAVNRTEGTLIGGTFGMGVLWLFHQYVPGSRPFGATSLFRR